MKLADMTFDESRNAEIKIAAIVERIMANKETADLCDSLFNPKGLNVDPKANPAKREIAKQAFTKKRMEATVGLTKRLVYAHYDDVCKIFGILNSVNEDEIKGWKRSEADAQLSEMFNDENLISFFMSSEALVQAAQYAIL